MLDDSIPMIPAYSVFFQNMSLLLRSHPALELLVTQATWPVSAPWTATTRGSRYVWTCTYLETPDASGLWTDDQMLPIKIIFHYALFLASFIIRVMDSVNLACLVLSFSSWFDLKAIWHCADGLHAAPCHAFPVVGFGLTCCPSSLPHLLLLFPCH